jgi:hypothetical protein
MVKNKKTRTYNNNFIGYLDRMEVGMRENFQRAFEYLKSPACEGGVFEVHLKGEIGDTICGITEKWYPDAFAKVKEYIQSGQQKIALAYIADFYDQNFYGPVGSNDLPYPTDIFAFIQSINQGLNTVKTILRGCQNDPAKFLAASKMRYDWIKEHNPAEAHDYPVWMERLQNLEKAFPVAT